MDLNYPEGATTLDPDENAGLKLSHITTREELNMWEQRNITEAYDWLDRTRNKDILSEQFVRMLHKKMWGKVWEWAGAFRRSNKNIGVDWPRINDGYLTPFKVKEFSTTGDTYQYTDDDEVLEGIVEEEREYSLEEQNRIIELMDVEEYRVKLLLDIMNQDKKTLVFCNTQIHAAAIRDLINMLKAVIPIIVIG